MNKEYYVAMTIDSSVVPSSAIIAGTKSKCDQIAARMNRNKDKHRSIGFVVVPCVGNPAREQNV